MNAIKTPEERQRSLDQPHMKACIYASRLVSGYVETRDETVRKPLVAMTRRIFEEVMGIRKRNPDTATVESLSTQTAHEVILEAELDGKLDVTAQQYLGKICVAEPEEVDFTAYGHALTSTSFILPEYFQGLRIERVVEADNPTSRYQLLSADIDKVL
jgi:hypothetical protein